MEGVTSRQLSQLSVADETYLRSLALVSTVQIMRQSHEIFYNFIGSFRFQYLSFPLDFLSSDIELYPFFSGLSKLFDKPLLNLHVDLDLRCRSQIMFFPISEHLFEYIGTQFIPPSAILYRKMSSITELLF
jgi:hypothetical protein